MGEEQKHSPGPWVVDKHAAFAVPAAGHMVYAEGGDEHNGHLVCQLHNVYSDNQKANANLIAAAPELLEVLTELTNILERYYPSYWSDTCEKAKAAIEKAQKGPDQ